jgi:hypothetical protein
LPHGYCTECRAQVTVRDGQCLLDHPIDPATIEETPGRRLRASARRRRGTHVPPVLPSVVRRELPSVDLEPAPAGGVALLEREEPAVTRHPLAPPPPTRLSEPADTGNLSLTGLLVEELWNLSPDEDILGWAPEELDSTLVNSGLRVRKILLLSTVALIVVLAGWRVLTWDGTRLAESMDAVTENSSRLVDDVEGLRGPVADLADGAVADPLAASAALARLDESARTMFAAVGDLPADEEIAPIREQAVTQASGALELGSILSEAVAYSAAVQLITRPVDLPTETDIDGLPSVTGAVTGWVGNFISGVSTLPGNDFTDTHRSALSALADSLSDWQAAYLDSLRGRDPERASARIDELETQIRFVRESWSTAAASISEWADQRIETLAVPLVVNR